MPTINEILGIGRTTLGVSRARLAVASFNIANANTPGYSRQVTHLMASPVTGQGVFASEPMAIRNPMIARNLGETYGMRGFYQGQFDSLALVQEAVNDIDGVGLLNSLDNFQNALRELSANPAGSAERQAVIGSAEQLSAQFSAVRRSYQQAMNTTRDTAEDLGREITLKGQQVATLNRQIKHMSQSGESIEALIDRRDQVILEISKLIDIDVVYQKDNSALLYAGGGRPLVTEVEALAVRVSPLGPPPGYSISVTFDRPDGSSLSPLPGHAIGGELGGLMEAQNTLLGPMINTIDEMAFEMASQFNALHSTGFDANGNPGVSFFEPIAVVAGAAEALEITTGFTQDQIATAANAIDVPGGNEVVISMADFITQTGVMPNGDSLQQTFDLVMQTVARSTQAAEVGLATEDASIDQLLRLLQSETGVSVDEELVEMTLANQAFEAASIVIRTASEMADTLLRLVG